VTIDEACEILSRARQGGAFDRWTGQLWRKAARDELRAHARALLGPELPGDLHVRTILRSRDRGEPRAVIGDDASQKDATLDRVWVSRDPPLTPLAGEPEICVRVAPPIDSFAEPPCS
jgi:hypothetical protein